MLVFLWECSSRLIRIKPLTLWLDPFWKFFSTFFTFLLGLLIGLWCVFGLRGILCLLMVLLTVSLKTTSVLGRVTPCHPPYLLLLWNYLSHFLTKSFKLKLIKFHQRYSRVRLSHLLFADDIMIFTHVFVSFAINLKVVLGSFSATTGLFVNSHNSHVFLGGALGSSLKYVIVYALDMPFGVFPMRYLGVSLVGSRILARHCLPLQEKILLLFYSCYVKVFILCRPSSVNHSHHFLYIELLVCSVSYSYEGPGWYWV